MLSLLPQSCLPDSALAQKPHSAWASAWLGGSSLALSLAPRPFPEDREVAELIKAFPLLRETRLSSKSCVPWTWVPGSDSWKQRWVCCPLLLVPVCMSWCCWAFPWHGQSGCRAAIEAHKAVHPSTSLLPGQALLPSHSSVCDRTCHL